MCEAAIVEHLASLFPGFGAVQSVAHGAFHTAAGVTCSSQPDGVRCWYVDNPATGLFASREKFSTLR